jgi:hypothetical protein
MYRTLFNMPTTLSLSTSFRSHCFSTFGEAGFKTFTSLLSAEIAWTARTSNNVGEVIAAVEGEPEGKFS